MVVVGVAVDLTGEAMVATGGSVIGDRRGEGGGRPRRLEVIYGEYRS